MSEKLKKGLLYTLKVFLTVSLLLGVTVGSFFSSMKMSNLYFLLNDALKARLDVILLNADIDDKSAFFTYDYLQSEEYMPLQENYRIYLINNYGHKLQYSNLFVFPWQTTKTVTVKEAVFAINGELDTTQMSKADAMAHDLYNIPAWKDSVYRVRLVYQDGSWLVDRITRRGDFSYEPVQTPSLTKEEIEALRTPTPEPTEPLPSGEIPSGDRPARISTALIGQTVNLREGPNVAYPILKVLSSGDKLTVKEEADGWYLVVTEDGTTGYVSGYYILFE